MLTVERAQRIAAATRGGLRLVVCCAMLTGRCCGGEPLECDSFVEPSAACSNRLPLNAWWDYGLKLASPDENFQLHVGGNLQWDSVWLIGPQSLLTAGNNANSTGNSGASLIRRARFKFDG